MHSAHAGKVRLSIRTFAVEKVDMPACHLASDDQTYTELTWPVEQPSASIPATVDSELLLFSKEKNTQGNEEFKVVRKLAVPETATQILLVAWPTDGAEKTELMVVADSLEQASSHDWVVVNTSQQVVSMRYGTNHETIELKPAEARPFRIHAEPDRGNPVLAQVRLINEWKTIYSTYWAAPEKQRSLVFFHDKDGRVKLRRVIDILSTTD